MSCIHKQFNETQNVHYCDCLNKLYCNKEHCNFYQSDKRYKHGLEIESNGVIYKTVVDNKPWLNHKPTVKTVVDNSGRNYQKI